ncbi:hypothetical protein [Ensifer sp. BR816]|uniref:hypothetical protein n=1 Tax=Rhizobium sp. (strain BR816) TaxID=1057002 RepID=UPI000373BDBC|nr:hypothetical protein [Ensifer sp. BR816]
MTGASLSGADPESVWTVFQTAPARLVGPRLIMQAFDNTIPIETAIRLQRSDRVQRPLARLISEKYRLPEPFSCPRPSEDDLELLAFPLERIEQYSHAAGAVFWGHVLAGEIRSREVAEMKSRIGDFAFQLAIHNRDLAAGHPPPGDRDQLMQAIETDGRKCWASWQASLPQPLAAWLRLRDGAANENIAFLQESDTERGAAIVRRLMQDKNKEAKEAG